MDKMLNYFGFVSLCTQWGVFFCFVFFVLHNLFDLFDIYMHIRSVVFQALNCSQNGADLYFSCLNASSVDG